MLKEETIAIQRQLADYCRTGESVEIEGSLSERLPHYRRLVYNVMYGLLEKAFPIIKSILSEEEFKSLVGSYMIDHDAQEPQVWKVPGEFYTFLKKLNHPVLESYPYLLDLAYLEWTEIFLFNQEEKKTKDFVDAEISEISRLALNPDSVILDFSYPVHKGDFDDIYNKKGDFSLLAFRNNSTKKVHFLEVSALHKDLIALLDNELSIEMALIEIADKFNLTNSAELKKAIIGFLQTLKEQRFVLGQIVT